MHLSLEASNYSFKHSYKQLCNQTFLLIYHS